MALIKWRPYRDWEPLADLSDLQKEINRLFNLSLGRKVGEGKWVPPIDIYRKGDVYYLEAEIPGVDKKDIEFTIQDNVVTIRGKKECKKEVKEEDYECYERARGEFLRTFELHVEVDSKKVKATFKEGVLHAELPIAESAKPKQIAIDIKEEK